jgi:ribonuclease Z
VVITGDTKLTPTVATVAQGADILVHEALQPALVNILGAEFEAKNMGNLAHVMRDILNYHTTPEEAAAQANAAQVKHLVYNHIVPPLPVKFAYPAFVGDAAKFFSGPITVGEDGMLFTLPANSTVIEKKQLM